jgi:hypothetical protein
MDYIDIINANILARKPVDLGEQARRFCRYRCHDLRHRQVHFII